MSAALADQARTHRSNLTGVTFIGITGSCGKTTTKDLAAGILKADFKGLDSPDYGNCGTALVHNLFRVQPSDDFYVQELGAWGPNTLDSGIDLVQPDIGVVLNIRNDHYTGFRGRHHTQQEKSKVIRCLPPTGTAILSADDPMVSEMHRWTPARVITFGRHIDADLQAREVRSPWPDRLSFDLRYRGTIHHVSTRLIGEHLLSSALAALAVAVSMGVSIETAISRLGRLPPTERRMSCATVESGITFIRDDFKATHDSMEEIVSFLAQARARRKVMVVGRISDYSGRSRRAYTPFAKAAAEVVNLLVFVGQRAEDLWGRQRRSSPGFLSEFDACRAQVQVFETVEDASASLRAALRPGDLVVLKGSGVTDHLERVLLQYRTQVRCWEKNCRREIACDECGLLNVLPSQAEGRPTQNTRKE